MPITTPMRSAYSSLSLRSCPRFLVMSSRSRSLAPFVLFERVFAVRGICRYWHQLRRSKRGLGGA